MRRSLFPLRHTPCEPAPPRWTPDPRDAEPHGRTASDAGRIGRTALPPLPPRASRGGRGHTRPLLPARLRRGCAHGGDSARSYLTGFSFGGNGVFDLALAQRELWAALWPVDPTRVPPADPGLPVWLSSGEVSRRGERGFVERLGLNQPAGAAPGGCVIVDRGQDHVGTATLAYADERIYDWLLARSAAAQPG